MNRDAVLAHAAKLARRYRLAAPASLSRGPAGVYQGAGGGQSIDFHNFREYRPGDDLRRVDWRAYARTGQMHLKLFREEVSPVVEIALDDSASMAAYPGKEQAAIFVAAFVAGAARAVGGRPVLYCGGRRFSGGEVEGGLSRAAFDAGAGMGGLADRSERPAANRPWRFLVSDFLVPEGGAALFAGQSAGALAFTPVFLLARSEREPSWTGGRRLVDVEDGRNMLDVVAGPASLAEYGRRLRRHEDGLAGEARRHGGRLLALTVPDGDLDDDGPARLARSLADAGVVAPG